MPDPTAFVARAREVLAKATPGKWASGGDEVYSAKPYHVVCHMCDDVPLDNDNSDAIVLAVNSLPALLDVVEAAARYEHAQRTYSVEAHGDFLESEAALLSALARLEVPE